MGGGGGGGVQARPGKLSLRLTSLSVLSQHEPMYTSELHFSIEQLIRCTQRHKQRH